MTWLVPVAKAVKLTFAVTRDLDVARAVGPGRQGEGELPGERRARGERAEHVRVREDVGGRQRVARSSCS